MSRSPLAYPLNRPADMDGGGAADLQTDIMRFMAILSLCLVAIFALVQSIPLTPVEPTASKQTTAANEGMPASRPPEVKAPAIDATLAAAPAPVAAPASSVITLTRPEWTPKFRPAADPLPDDDQIQAADAPAPDSIAVAPSPETTDGFTLRFESDAALMRAVAAGRVGLYAIDSGRARRMAVSNSRISFWDASTPGVFHEMESSTVPAAVLRALATAGTLDNVSWGVTLPGTMTKRLDSLMQSNSGGSLIIGADGHIRLEAL